MNFEFTFKLFSYFLPFLRELEMLLYLFLGKEIRIYRFA